MPSESRVACRTRLQFYVLQDDEIRARYGPDVSISRKGRFVLVHLDSPGEAVVRRRTEAFDPDIWFEADCPLCQIQRAAGVCVFDGYPDEEEWILLD